MPRFSLPFFSFILVLIIISSCQHEAESRFERLSSEQTGITFTNQLTPSPELNIFNYLYFYDGAGVAAGDLNGNGLPDLYFTSNQGENKLYLNKGDFKFTDATSQAFNVSSSDWSTGVTFVDINNDGRLDIYVSNVGGHLSFEGRNQLFINQGNDENEIPQFEEKAGEYGLDFQGLATQAVFFDYDLDGDLDMYMMNHSVHSFGTYMNSSLREESNPIAGDRLLRNDGGTFVDVTEEAGIYNSPLGYGLGIGISDINGDNLPDIYIGNDFHEDDYLYINNGDGTFTESLGEMIGHTSYSSMGNDIVDFNNDGLPDIISLDMLPEEYEKLKASAAEDPLDIYNTKLEYGYSHQFTRNTLQLNRGNGKFSEIGMLAGVHATDWSWASLGADFNHNGFTDLFITNGIYGRTNDLDYITYITQDEIQQRLEGDLTQKDADLAEHAPAAKVPNYMYSNNGSLIFDDVSEQWGFGQPTFSSGAIYADLNNDGDLDLVINNVNQKASIYRNMTRERYPRSDYLKIEFNGPDGNRFGIGTTARISRRDADDVLIRELYPVRGFQSSTEPVLHFGLDSLQTIGKLYIQWPDGRIQVLEDVQTNQTLVVDYTDATEPAEENNKSNSIPLFEDITDQLGVSYKHEENNFIEFNREPLIPHMVSREGPALAIGDVNGDGLEDFYAGGAKRQAGSLYLQEPNGTFTEKEIPAFEDDFIQEDVDAHFTDFTGNGAEDLLVISGGNEYSGSSEYMLPRLYLNDGQGNFTRGEENLPEIYLSGSIAAIGDANGDGHPDIFLGARAVPWSYGERPESYLLINNGEGRFVVDESEYGKQFSGLGMVTGAEWADLDNNGQPELVVASEWENLKIIYDSAEKGIVEIPGSSGLWNTVAVTDLNQDGELDILAGNLGLNSKFKASESAPLRMYVNDFDDNGITDQIITYIDKDGHERLFTTKDELGEQLPYIHEKFETYHAFAEAGLYDVIDRSMLRNSLIYTANELRTSVFYNNSSGFTKKHLPVEAQFAPVFDFLIHDLNQNGYPDVVSAGNFFDANIQRGRYDADYGTILINEQEGELQQLPNQNINWYLEGQIKRLDIIQIGSSRVMIAAENDERLKFFRIHTLPESVLATE